MATELDRSAYAQALTGLQERARAAGFRPYPLAGVSVGGCVEAIGTERQGAFRRKAHAHSGSEHRGWICILSPNPARIVGASGKATALFAHEYAHILTPSEWHGERWQRAVTALGHPGEAKRARRR